MKNSDQLTIIQDSKQQKTIKSLQQKYPDAILLFRDGNFYRAFGNDAIIIAYVLGITLTKTADETSLFSKSSGFRDYRLDLNLHKLARTGYRVAICDELTATPPPNKPRPYKKRQECD